MKDPRHVSEWLVRGITLLGGAAVFAFTVLTDVSRTASTLAGAALILGLYFGLTDWAVLRSRRATARRRNA